MSPKQTCTFGDPFAPVSLEPVTVAGQEVASKTAVVVTDDQGNRQTVGIQGRDYNLITNAFARDLANDIMSRSGMSWSPLKTLWDGKRYCQYYLSDKVAGEITNGERMPVHVGIMLRNAYDGSSAFGLEVYACNMVCTNQYHNRNLFGFFAIRHTGDRELKLSDALTNLQLGVGNVIKAMPVLQQLKAEPLKIEHITQAKEKTKIPQSKWGDVLDQLNKEAATRFGLFQALTYVASHQLSGFSSISIGDSIGQHFISNQ